MSPIDHIDLAHSQLRAHQADLLRLLTDRGVRPRGGSRLTWVGDLQQGDGGKGAMTDRLAPFHQLVVRVQGGDNAGHTVVFAGDSDRGETVLKHHLIPAGLRHAGTVGLLANGVLVNPDTLAKEIEALAARGIDVAGRLLVSDRAHVVLPMHLSADSRQEEARGRQSDAIGTTRRGIGPVNVCKANRTGIRVGDLADLNLVRLRLEQNARLLQLPSAAVAENLDWVIRYRDGLLAKAVDATAMLNAAADAGYSILLEGAQGPLIDIDQGIYPFVTTSPTTFHSVAPGTGVDPARVGHRIGVLKAYQTMVGNGSFVTEDTGALGSRLRNLGSESGTTTGRPRRCGWVDLPHARWAADLNGCTSIVLTKIDVLDDFDRIAVCVGYEHQGVRYAGFRPEETYLRECTPIYHYLPGWQSPTGSVRRYAELPAEAVAFIDFVSRYLQRPISAVSKGPASHDLLVVPGGELDLTPVASAPSTHDTHTVGGPRHPASARETTRVADEAGPSRIVVFCGASPGTRREHQSLAAELGQACARGGVGVVYGAGGAGVMGALSDAVLAARGEIIGVIPQALMDREYGREDLSELRVVASMHERKALMHQLGHACIALPGGYGTFEELFETITWTQLGLHHKPVVLLDNTGYFDPLIKLMDHALAEGFISEDDRSMVHRATTVDEALAFAGLPRGASPLVAS
jgi:adenylosuccinate synthase